MLFLNTQGQKILERDWTTEKIKRKRYIQTECYV